MTELVYSDGVIAVCIKPAGVLSTDEPGGVPELVREALGDNGACVRTVHRLDRVVGGLMLLARTPECASELSRQVRDRSFEKSYLAVAHVAADRASLLGSDVAVVTIVQVDADLAGSFHLEAIHSITCGRIYEIGTLRHLQASPFSSFGL